jgi:hypothetical protein
MASAPSLCTFTSALLLTLLLFAGNAAEAATYYWAVWNSYSFDGTTYTLTGSITTGGGDTVTVTYTNTQGLAGYQLSGGTGGTTNYWSGGTDGASGTSPYTSATVENRPDNVTIIRLSNAGTQTLTFSQNVADLALAFVSLNGNAFSFDRNFDILSYGDPSDGGNACGFWGCGTATKTAGSGAYPYVVSGTGEPHGTLHFSGSFDSLTWTSGNENWHGFTVGIAGIASAVVTDTSAPTVVINPAHGTTNVALNASVTIAFDEEVRNLDDTPLTDTNVDGLIVLKSNNATGADIPFDATIDAASKVITIVPATEFLSDQIIYVAIGATVEDRYNNAIAATSATFTTGSSFPVDDPTYDDPRTKQDVVGNAQAWSNLAQRWAKFNLDAMASRLEWLRRNEKAHHKSHHAARITAADPLVNGLIRVASGSGNSIASFDAAALAQKLSSDPAQVLGNAEAALIDILLSQVVAPFGPVLGKANTELTTDAALHWSWWTHGEVAVGKVRGSDSASRQNGDNFHAFLGMDRPFDQDGVVGFVIGLGKSDTEVGSSGSGVESDNYAISGYTAVKLAGLTALEVTLGYGRVRMDVVRIDNSQTLSGKRDADQLFGSVALRGESLRYGNFSASPFGRFEASRTRFERFSEAGGDMALAFERQYLDTSMMFVGANAEYVTNERFRPFGKLEYGANTSGSSDVNMRYVSDTTDYGLTLTKRATSLWKTEIGFDYRIKTAVLLSFAYAKTHATSEGYADSLKLHVDLRF